MLVEPQLQRRAHKAGDQTHCIPRIQTFFDLALKLRVQHLGRQHVAGACKDVLRHQLDALGQQAVHVNKAFHRGKQAVAQAALMGAARAGGDEVHIALAHRAAVFGKGHAPHGALALGKAVVLGIGKTFSTEQRNHRVGLQGLHQIVGQTAFVKPALAVLGLFIQQRHAHAGHQNGLAAQQMHQLGHGQSGRFKVLGVRPDAHRGARFAVALARLADLQRLGHVATLEHDTGHRTLAVAGGLQAFAQRVGHTHTHAMQAAREAVSAAFALVKLATRVQPREHQLDHRGVFFRVHAKRNATTIVFDRDRAVGVQHDLDFLAMAGQGLVSRVVQHLLNDVQGVVGAGVHARSLLDGLKTFEDPDRRFGVSRCGGRGGFRGRHRERL